MKADKQESNVCLGCWRIIELLIFILNNEWHVVAAVTADAAADASPPDAAAAHASLVFI